MGTTRIKVIDLSSEQKEIKTSRKHAEKLTGIGKLTAKKKPKDIKDQKPTTTEDTEKTESTEKPGEHPRGEIEASPGKHPGGESRSTSMSSVVAKKPASPRHSGKKYKQAVSLIDKNKTYSAKEAIQLLGKTSFTKFDPTVEIHLNVSEKNIKGSVNLPHPFGKKKEKKILVFTDKKIPQNQNIITGNTKTVEEIQNGSMRPGRDFDTVIAEPKFMPQLVKIAKILGPRGMMPNPKDKTIVDKVQDAIDKIGSEKSSFEFKGDPTAPIIHSVLGKLSAKPDHLEENFKSIVLAIGKTKIKKAIIKSTMSPAISVDINSLST